MYVKSLKMLNDRMKNMLMGISNLVLKVKMLRAGVENVIWFWSSQKRFCVYV